MVLDEVCNAKVYSANAFYVLGLPVNVNSRKIRRREEDLIDGLGAMGGNAWSAEFDKYLLGYHDAPKVETARKLIERLKSDPEYFATEMFFWFWPQVGGQDPAIDAIMTGERDKAVCCWRADCAKPGSRGVIARHNLAVIVHLYAIDGEYYIQSTSGDVGAEYFKAVDQFWKESFSFWEEIVDADEFWDVYASRVEELNDPRLDEKFIEEFRERIPICFDNINADFMVAYASAGKLNEAKRHFDYMASTMSGGDDIEETMGRAFMPMVDKVRTMIKQCEGTKDPKKVLGVCRELLNGSKSLVLIFKTLVPKGNAFTRGVLNEIVATVDGCLPVYSRETGDYEPCLNLTRELLPIAATPLQTEKIQKAIKEWENLIREERERSTCCVCGRCQKNIATKTVKMYNNVREDPLMPGRVEWRTRTISNVPVCVSCVSRFKYEHARNFGPVKVSLADGWKFGEKPSQYEMDNARFF